MRYLMKEFFSPVTRELCGQAGSLTTIKSGTMNFLAIMMLMPPTPQWRTALTRPGEFVAPPPEEFALNIGACDGLGATTGCIQSRIAEVLCELGHLDQALGYTAESALVMNVRPESRLACAVTRGQVHIMRDDLEAASVAFEAVAS